MRALFTIPCPILLALLAACPGARAQPAAAPGGGDLNPGLATDSAALAHWRDMKLGLSIHWGPSALGGEEISWSRGERIPRARYDSFYLAFDPTGFDAAEWVALAEAGGLRYVVPTSKHHDGFALWSSAASPYDVDATPFGRDVVRELSDAARAAGLTFGTYYSIIDWYHPDFAPYDHGGPGPLIAAQSDSPDFERYLRYAREQLRELIEDYGARIVQFDGEWVDTWDHARGSELYAYVKGLDSTVIVNSRVDVGRYHLDSVTGAWNTAVYAGDYDERERMVDWIDDAETRDFVPSATPWQAWVTIDRAQWAYNPGAPRLLSADSLLVDLVTTVAAGGNYLVNLGPRPDGTFVPAEAAILREVGRWVRAHPEAIYGTREGPLADAEAGRYVSTQSDSAVYVFVLDPALEALPKAPLTTTAASERLGAFTTYDGTPLEDRAVDGGEGYALPEAGDLPVRVIRAAR